MKIPRPETVNLKKSSFCVNETSPHATAQRNAVSTSERALVPFTKTRMYLWDSSRDRDQTGRRPGNWNTSELLRFYALVDSRNDTAISHAGLLSRDCAHLVVQGEKKSLSVAVVDELYIFGLIET